MPDEQEHTEKRKVTTWLSPQLLQIFLPVILAAGSGFLIHDRDISRLKSVTESHATSIRDYNTEFKDVSQLLGDLAVLRERVLWLEEIHKDSKRIDDEILSLTRSLQQRIEFSDEQLRDFKARIRELERQVDRLSR